MSVRASPPAKDVRELYSAYDLGSIGIGRGKFVQSLVIQTDFSRLVRTHHFFIRLAGNDARFSESMRFTKRN